MSGWRVRARAMCRCARRKSVGGEIDDLAGRCDLVLIDAPCTGTGSWRRNPDAKWRMRPARWNSARRSRPRFSSARCRCSRPAVAIAYVTCSVLDEENGTQVRAFLARHPEFSVQPPADIAKALGERAAIFGKAARLSAEGILMTAAHDRDRRFLRQRAAAGRLSARRRINDWGYANTAIAPLFPGQKSPR